MILFSCLCICLLSILIVLSMDACNALLSSQSRYVISLPHESIRLTVLSILISYSNPISFFREISLLTHVSTQENLHMNALSVASRYDYPPLPPPYRTLPLSPYSLITLQFGTRQLLKKHCMWHTGERSHVCPHCSKAFFQVRRERERSKINRESEIKDQLIAEGTSHSAFDDPCGRSTTRVQSMLKDLHLQIRFESTHEDPFGERSLMH